MEFSNHAQALAIDAANAKGLFRRGTALLHMGELDASRADFRKALEIEPGNAATIAGLNEVKAKIQAEKDAEKKRYGAVLRAYPILCSPCLAHPRHYVLSLS